MCVAIVLVTYLALTILLWPLLSVLGLCLVAASLFVSVLGALWMEGIFEATNPNRSLRAKVADLRYSLVGALSVPAPFLSGALALVWWYEHRPSAALAAILVAGALAIFQVRQALLDH